MSAILLVFLACTQPEPKDTSTPFPESTDTEDSTPDLSLSQELLRALRQDPAQAMLDQSRSGWPAQTPDGWLFVSLDPQLTLLTGDFEAWTGTPMIVEAGFSWLLVEELSQGDGYKFTDGTNYEPDPWATAYRYDAYGEISLVAPPGAHLERYPGFGTETLEDRALHIWVPAEPVSHVFYAHDGQNLFDPAAIWGGWHMQDTAPAGLLIVGIDNTPARMDEYTHVKDDIGSGDIYGGLADAYQELLTSEVRPFVQKRFGEPGPVGLIGSSLGGLISLYLAYQEPGAYDFAASLSGTVGWGSIGLHNPTLIELMRDAGHQSTGIYLDSGGNGVCFDGDGDGIDDDDSSASDNYCENIQLRDTLADVGYQYEQDLWHWWEPEAEHNEMAWAARVEIPMSLFVSEF